MNQEIGKLQDKNINVKKGKNKLLIKLLRVLQLFCEGHHLHLQTYMKHQTNSKINYDLVILTVNSLESLNICNENFDVISQCLETLTDYSQGPCPINQMTIVNSKFLDYAVEILNVYYLILYFL